MDAVEFMVQNHPMFKEATGKITEGFEELSGLELTVEKSNFGRLKTDEFIKGISQVAYAQLDKE